MAPQAALEPASAKATARQASNPPVHPELRRVTIEGLRMQLKTLNDELAQYDAIKAGTTKLRGTLDDLGELLVQARIARSWTQAQLAEWLELYVQQIQVYESTNYEGASLTRLVDVARALGLDLEIRVELLAIPDLRRATLASTSSAAGQSKTDKQRERRR